MTKAEKTDSGKWRVRASYLVDGKQKFKSFTAPTKKEAEHLAAVFEAELVHAPKGADMKFKDALEQYIQSKNNVLSESTIRGYVILQRTAFSLIDDKKLSDIVRDNYVQKLINANAADYKLKSLKNQFGLISAVLKANKLPVETPTFPAQKENPVLVPTMQEIKKIVKILKDYPDIECQVLLALTCSLRQSEIAALTPAHFVKGYVYVNGARVPNQYEELVLKETNKTKDSTRKVKMPSYLADRIKEVCEGKAKNEFVFTLSPNALRLRFSRILKNNNLPNFSIHSMRHAFVAYMHDAGVEDAYIQAMGGWRTDNVMKSVYMYAFADEVDKKKSRVNKKLDKLLGK